jgi:hypothetical protein
MVEAVAHTVVSMHDWPTKHQKVKSVPLDLTEVKVDMVTAWGRLGLAGTCPTNQDSATVVRGGCETKHLNLTRNFLATAMARRREKPAGDHVTPPRKPKKLRSGSRPGNSHGNKSIMDRGLEGTKLAKSTPNVGMSRPTAGSHSETLSQFRTPQVNQDALHRTMSGTPSVANPDEDQDSSFSDTADRILSPRSNNIENLRSEYHQFEKQIEEVYSHLPSTTLTDEEATTLRQYFLLCELKLAQAKLRLDIAMSYETTRYGQQNTTDLPKLAITKGWLDESMRRIETPALETNCESGYLFKELSHFFLATIITLHHDAMFLGRPLPSVPEMVDVFQRTEPRSFAPGLGPFLELATGMTTEDPLLMPEILRRLESRLATDTSIKDRRDLDTNTNATPREEQSQLGHQSGESGDSQSPIYRMMDGEMIELEIDPNLDAPSSAGNSPVQHQTYRYDDRVEENEFKLEDEQETSRPNVAIDEQMERIDGRMDDKELMELEEPSAQQVELDFDMDLHDERSDHTTDPQPFYIIREGSTGLGTRVDDRAHSVVSDFSVFDEVMEDVQETENNSDAPTASQTMHRAKSPESSPAALAPTPSQPWILDSFVMSDDEPEPDSNPCLAAHRAKTLASASASASASTSNIPVSNTPVTSLSDDTRRAKPRKSEPIVLISSPARPYAEDPGSRRQSSRISDSMFISDDNSDDDLPLSSNPHLAALIRARASVSAPARASGSNTPTSSASSSKSAKSKLPPHLAPVRRAAQRQSLNPSSQVPTTEEKQLLDQEEYPLIDIIDEKVVEGEKKYLIKWKPIHGRRFLDTWEPAENANAASVEDWEIEKTRRDKGKEKRKTKTKTVVRSSGGKQREKQVENAATEPATQESPVPAPSSLPEDTPMFFADTAGDESLASRGVRSVSALHTPSSSPANSSASDQVSSRTRSRLSAGDDSLVTFTESATQLTSEPVSDSAPRYATQPFPITAVSPQPIPNTPTSSKKVDNSGKYKTQAQQKARMREKRAIRRAEKEEKLANMSEAKRAELEHSKKMHKKSKKERKDTKEERLAAMPEEERRELEEWLRWKKDVRERTKRDKKARQANKAKKREKAAQKAAQKDAQRAADAS